MILAVIAAMTLTAQAQVWETIEIGDWENPTTYNGSYFDMAPTNFYVAHTGAQMLYTPDMLAALNDKQNVRINGMTFMFYDETFEEIARNIKIFIYETDATEFAVVDGKKQFFPLGEQVWEEDRTYDMLYFYGEDYTVPFRFNYPYTPGKSLVVTITFDAFDDDNCTMGSDYAPFYTSDMRKALTYTNNWNSFEDYVAGEDFPDATATLGCGTNVELPLTKFQFYYEESGITLLSEANAPEDAAEFTFDGDAVVTVCKNGYVFLRDESGYGMIAGVEDTFENGQVLSQGWTATKTTVNNTWVRYTDAAGLSASGETNAELAAAQKLTSAPDESMLNAYVYIENALPNSSSTPILPQRYFTLPDNSKLYVTDCLWASDWDASGNYNFYGVLCKDRGQVRINVVKFEPYVEPQPTVLRGDVNGNGAVNMDDLTALIYYLVNGTEVNVPNTAACNSADDTTVVNMDDLTALIDYLVYGHWSN